MSYLYTYHNMMHYSLKQITLLNSKIKVAYKF